MLGGRFRGVLLVIVRLMLRVVVRGGVGHEVDAIKAIDEDFSGIIFAFSSIR
jgi:hypothetical protein